MQVARAIDAVLELQADPRRSATRVALDHGYSGHSGLNRLVANVFRLRVSAAREILGWEPLLDRCMEDLASLDRGAGAGL